MTSKPVMRCSFCGKSYEQVRSLWSGGSGDVYTCNELRMVSDCSKFSDPREQAWLGAKPGEAFSGPESLRGFASVPGTGHAQTV
jgi:hypothetical protein